MPLGEKEFSRGLGQEAGDCLGVDFHLIAEKGAEGIPRLAERRLCRLVFTDDHPKTRSARRFLVDSIILQSVGLCNGTIHLAVSDNSSAGREESADQPPLDRGER
jgi:hypothetical protein